MAAGDVLIRREATGGETISTTQSSLPFDTSVRSDAIYSDTALAFTLNETGHFFVAYNIGFENTTVNERSEVQGALRVGGSVQDAYGRASGFTRGGDGLDEAWLNAATILDVTSGDVVNVRVQRTDSGTGGTTDRLADATTVSSGCGVQFLKLDDSWSYCRLRRSTDEGVSTGTIQNIEWNVQDELDTADFSHSTVTNPDEITLDTAGHYLVTVSMVIEATTTGRFTPVLQVLIGASTVVGRVTRYSRTDINSCTTLALTWSGIIETTSANEILTVGYAHIDTVATGTPQGNGIGIAIVKLPDTADYIRLAEATGGQATNVDAPITWDTQDEIDTASFTHSTSTNPSRITVDQTDDYLFFSTQYTDRTPIFGVNRISHHYRWNENGTASLWGDFGGQNRGNQSAQNNVEMGASGAFLVELTANDYVELDYIQESTNTDSGLVHLGGRQGLQAVRLGSLFGQALVQVVGDTLSLQDDAIPVRGLVRVLSDTLGLQDDSIPALGLTRIVSDTLTLQDAVLPVLGLVRQVGDTLQLDDDPLPVLGLVRVVGDQLDLSDAVAHIVGKLRQVDDTLELTDEALAVVEQVVLQFVSKRLSGGSAGAVAGGGGMI